HYTAEAVAHESGHTFGLQHQSTYSGSTKTNEYNPGDSNTAPIMGDSYYAARGLWWYGLSSLGPTTYQDDMATISHNSFGYRTDDDNGIATALAGQGTGNLSGAGVVAKISDSDVFSFQTAGGPASITVNANNIGPMLDLRASLYNSTNHLIVSSDT